MEDRFKFRAWHKGIKKMLNISNLNLSGGVSTASDDKNTFYFLLIQDMNLMQCTGLKDKNGTLIYEGDIIRILYTDWASKSEEDTRTIEQYKKDKSSIGKVCFIDDSWEIVFWNSKYKEWNPSSIFEGKHGEKEIIGNIHDNPELLTKGDN